MATGREAIKIFKEHTGSPTKAAALAREFGLTAHPDRPLTKQQAEKIAKKFEPTAASKGIKLSKHGQDSYGLKQTVLKGLTASVEPKPSAPKEKETTPSTFDFLERIRGRSKPNPPVLSPQNNAVYSASDLARQPDEPQ